MTASIRIEGLAELTGKLDSLAKLEAVKTALTKGAAHVKGKIAKYPPSTEANRPGRGRWYQRGFGPRWSRVDGSVGGSRTSETLGRKWTFVSRNQRLTWIVGNNVTYGIFVQGEKQAHFHKARGWRTTDDVIEKEGPEVVKMVKKEVDRLLEA